MKSTYTHRPKKHSEFFARTLLAEEAVRLVTDNVEIKDRKVYAKEIIMYLHNEFCTKFQNTVPMKK